MTGRPRRNRPWIAVLVVNAVRRAAGMTLAIAALVCAVGSAGAQADADRAPSGGATDGPRSRLMISGVYEIQSVLQKNFFLGAANLGAVETPFLSDRNAFWTQRLTLRPRFILADNLNLNLSVDLAHGIWGIDNESPEGAGGYSDLWDEKGTSFAVQLDQAFVAYRHAGTKSRWYLGRQHFGLGRQLVLDADMEGIQVYRDLPGWSSTVGIGAGKQSENADALTDQNGLDPNTPAIGPDGRDADLLYAEWRTETASGGFAFNPFAVYYLDRSNADGTTFLPQGQGILESRFRPNVTRATVFGVSTTLRQGILRLDAEADLLSGVDRVPNTSSGLLEVLDVNNGDISGSNVYGRLSLNWPRLELAGLLAIGSGDPDPFQGEGNVNHLRLQGNFFVTEVWEDGLALDETGLVPEGLGNSFTRGYRGLENTTLYQGSAAVLLRSNLKLTGRFTVIRATEALRPWTDSNGDGVITADEYGRDAAGRAAESTDMGSEISGRVDWTIERNAVVTLRGGFLSSGPAMGYLLFGTDRYVEDPFEMQIGLTIPIPEFSLGG